MQSSAASAHESCGIIARGIQYCWGPEMTRAAGVIVPAATPLHPDGSLDERALRRLLRSLAASADGVFVLGSSGELSWLPDTVASEVRRVAAEELLGQIPLYVGAGDTSTARAIERIKRLTPDSCDFAVVTGTFYYPVGQRELTDHFARIADVSPVPVLLYNIPQNTGVAISPQVVEELALHENIVGIKDSSGEMLAFLELISLSTEKFSVLQGREQLLTTSIWAGADGIVSALGNIAPRLLRAAIDAVASGNAGTASSLQRDINSLARLFEHGYWMSALKAALDVMGFGAGPPTTPLSPCSGDQLEVIKAILSSADPRWLLQPIGWDES